MIYSVKDIKLPSVATFEVLATHIHGAGKQFVLAAVYQPGSKSVTTQFVSDLADIIERLVVYAAPLVIVGDLNVHLNDIQSAVTVGVNKSAV